MKECLNVLYPAELLVICSRKYKSLLRSYNKFIKSITVLNTVKSFPK